MLMKFEKYIIYTFITISILLMLFVIIFMYIAVKEYDTRTYTYDNIQIYSHKYRWEVMFERKIRKNILLGGYIMIYKKNEDNMYYITDISSVKYFNKIENGEIKKSINFKIDTNRYFKIYNGGYESWHKIENMETEDQIIFNELEIKMTNWIKIDKLQTNIYGVILPIYIGTNNEGKSILLNDSLEYYNYDKTNEFILPENYKNMPY